MLRLFQFFQLFQLFNKKPVLSTKAVSITWYRYCLGLVRSLSLVFLSCLLSLHLKANSVVSRGPARATDGAEFFFAPIPDTEPKPILSGINGGILIFMDWTLSSENYTHNTGIQRRTSHQASIPPFPEESTLPAPFSTPDTEDDYHAGIIFEAELNLLPRPTHTFEETGEDLNMQPEPIGREHLTIMSSEGYSSTAFSYQPRQVPVESEGGSSVTGTTAENHGSDQSVDPTCTSSTMPVPAATCVLAMNESPDENTKALVSGTGLKIAVCAQQYPSPSIFTRGYGDIASGIRGLEILQQRFPEAEFTFIVEHFSQNKYEWLTLNTMSTIPAAQTFFLESIDQGEKTVQLMSDEQKQQHRLNAEQALDNADFILHGPFWRITPVDLKWEKYAKKILLVSEYRETKEWFVDRDDIPDGLTRNTGFVNNRLYLNDRKHCGTRFNNKILDELITVSGTRALYFAYGHHRFIQSMLNVLLLIEGTSVRDVVLVSPYPANRADSLVKEIQQAVAIKTTDSKAKALFGDRGDPEIEAIVSRNIILSFCCFEKIKIVCFDSAGSEQEITLFENPQGESIKSIRLIHPFPVDENDLFLLQKYSVVNYASGDISMSDILALGKIPLVDSYKKWLNYDGLRFKLTEFSAGNNDWEALVKGWSLASNCYRTEFMDELVRAPEEMIQSVQLLGSTQWLQLEKKFTDWLKTNANIAPFIIQKAEEVITKRK